MATINHIMYEIHSEKKSNQVIHFLNSLMLCVQCLYEA